MESSIVADPRQHQCASISMGPAGKTQHAIRRSTRLPLEVPVVLGGNDAGVAFSVPCSTTLVNAHGCGLIVPRSLPTGTQVRLEIVSNKRSTTARVAELVPLGGEPETWLVGLELDTPGNFWGIEYAPSDWKIEEVISPPAPIVPLPVASAQSAPGVIAATTKQAAAKVEAAPAPAPIRSRRWRLTDISGGACYLETGMPFPVNTPVLLSIRSQNTECLLDGIVRVSHEQGIGIEFTGSQGRNQRARVEELIGRLMSDREVPKIFVGRKEGKQATVALETAINDDTQDPLLELIRRGVSLSAEEFFSDLRAQRESS